MDVLTFHKIGLGVFKPCIWTFKACDCPGPICNSPLPLHPEIGIITILGVATVFIVVGEKLKLLGVVG